ncbi:MAG: SdrD B-like domain-containing protein [Runella sp.]
MKKLLHAFLNDDVVRQRWLPLLVVCQFYVVAAQAQVSGSVFYDYDSNGKQTNSNPTELGVEGVKVSVFVGSNATPAATTTTDSTGAYSFNSSQVPAGSKVRVEFSDFPETFSPTLKGINSNTSVQFTTTPATNINLGITNDDEFCREGDGPKVATACYVMGDPLKPAGPGDDPTKLAGDDPALVLFDYNAQGLAGVDDFSMVKLAKAKEIGPTWIASYQRDSKRLLVGAIVRRHVGLGPLGTGGLYYIDMANGNSVHDFIDVKTLGIDTGPDPQIDPITNQNILPAMKTARSHDSLTFFKAGKVGMGGVQLSRFQDTLFLINLYDKKLYSFLANKPLAPPNSLAEAKVRSYTIPHPNCSNGDFAPWALKYYRNKLYIGVVCTAETSQKKSDLKGAVYALSFKNYQFTKELEFPLDYIRDPLDATQGCDTINTWRPWSKAFPAFCNYPNGAPDPINSFLVNAQPILSDIEFDDDGSMIIGMMDRGGLQTGQDQPGIAKNDTLHYFGFMSGDLLRAQRNKNGTFTMESNGTSGKFVATGQDGSVATNPTDLAKSSRNKNAGPGGGEFFFDDFWINAKDSVGHAEITNGGVFKIPGYQEVFSSAMDPIHKQYLATGFITFDTKTGARKRSYSIYSVREGVLGKSGGVGDLTATCDPAPLEIGNRVWFDKNKNGIQDADEPGIDNLVLTLHDMANGGLQVAKDTTKNGGQFYFNDKNVTGGLKRTHNYQIRMSTNQLLQEGALGNLSPGGGGGQGSMSTFAVSDSLTLSPVLTDSANLNRNSEGVFNSDSSQVIVAVKTGNNSENNHNFDIGLMMKDFQEPPVDLELTKMLVGDCERKIGDNVVFKIIVSNRHPDVNSVADSVFVKDILPLNFSFVSAVPTQGMYDLQTGLWGPLTLESGESDTLTLTVKINNSRGFEGGNLCNEAEVFSVKQQDIDSTPNNSKQDEDDYDIACVSVPIMICPARKDTVVISAPAGYNKYQWFKDGVKLDGATAQTLDVSQPGNYTVEVADGQCPAQSCCPAIIREECICPPEICVPFTTRVIKVK